MRWFTSDLHFGHANIARFCDRPFLRERIVDGAVERYTDVDSMNAAIIANMNAHVAVEDELWILGDVAMGNIDHTLKLVQRFTAGRVVIVTGNHDRCHPCNGTKAEKWLQRYETDTGANVINGNTELVLANGVSVQVSHFPYEGESHVTKDGKDRFVPWRPVDDGRWLLCGHVHDAWQQRGRIINVGIDAWGGVPVSEAAVCDLMEQGPADRARIPW